jgi:hypothetical protein
MNSEITPIEYPWLIVHQPGGEGNPIRTMIAGPTNAGHEQFGLLLCDVLRHVAAAKGVREQDVFEWIEKEFKKPTTNLTVEYQSPRGRA